MCHTEQYDYAKFNYSFFLGQCYDLLKMIKFLLDQMYHMFDNFLFNIGMLKESTPIERTVVKELRNGTLLVADRNGNVSRYQREAPKITKKTPKRHVNPKPTKIKQFNVKSAVYKMRTCFVKLTDFRLDAEKNRNQLMPQLKNENVEVSVFGEPIPFLLLKNIIFNDYSFLVLSSHNARNPVVGHQPTFHSTTDDEFLRIHFPGNPNRTIILDKQIWLPVILLFARIIENDVIHFQISNDGTLRIKLSDEPNQTIILSHQIWLPIFLLYAYIFETTKPRFASSNEMEMLTQMLARLNFTDTKNNIGEDTVGINSELSEYDDGSKIQNCSGHSYDADNDSDSNNSGMDDSDTDSSWGSPMSTETFNENLANLLKNGGGNPKLSD